MAKKKEKLAVKKKKKWFKIMAPEYFRGNEVGETAAADARMLLGRTIKVPLSQITRNMKDHNTEITLQINKFTDMNGHTFTKKITIQENFIKRFVRKNTTRIDYSFITDTKDGKTARIKPVIITRYKIKGLQKKICLKRMMSKIISLIKDMTCEELVQTVIFKKLNREITKNAGVNKVAPIKFFDIRILEILTEKELSKAEKAEELAKQKKEFEEITKEDEKEAEKEAETLEKKPRKKAKTEEESKELEAEEAENEANEDKSEKDYE